jgi:plasmid stabilization system protein ParE
VKPLRTVRAARADLQSLRRRSIDKWGESHWAKRAAMFDDAFERIRRFPSAGQDREEFLMRMRSINVSPHVIFYREDPDAIVILRIVDGRRDLPKLKFS